MTHSGDHPTSKAEPVQDQSYVADERWELLQRILASKHFARAAQLRDILIYVTRRILADPNASVPEHEIACKVLGRREDFNPNDDNIVRVQAGHVRRKLEQYFASEGREETLILVIPKGSYVPEFELRPASSGREARQVPLSGEGTKDGGTLVQTLEESTPLVLPDAISQGSKNRSTNDLKLGAKSIPRAYLYSVLVAFAFGLGTMLVFTRAMDPDRTTLPSRKSPARNLIEQRIFTTDLPVGLVITDASLVLLQSQLSTDISISEYAGGQYPSNLLAMSQNPSQKAALTTAAIGRYTSLADLLIARQCEEAARRFGVQTSIRYARYTHMREFETGNHILIGSRRGNPWVSLFEPQLNFVLEEKGFRNRNPKSGESGFYSDSSTPRGEYISYADVALLSNLSKTGSVLLIDGSVMDSNEAAAQMIFGTELPPSLVTVIGLKEASRTRSVELFLRVHSLQGAAQSFDVIAVRQLPS